MVKSISSTFVSAYNGKKVLVTGHTGFKGAWLCSWLKLLGANVVGVSSNIPTSPSLYEEAALSNFVHNHCVDVTCLNDICKLIASEKPDFIFHLAAQAIVSHSYKNPVETIMTNTVGTTNVLEALREADWPCTAIFITSDKCYENIEWTWGYRENDRLGGKDIYSASKGAAEVILRAYFESFIRHNRNVRLGVTRAGNVVGGGDWAADRIVADCMRAWSRGDSVSIRCPDATRPWQHVLEPLSGYLLLGASLCKSDALNGEAFNFGPNGEQNKTVRQLIQQIHDVNPFPGVDNPYVVENELPFNEAGLLKLNCDKALHALSWTPCLTFEPMSEIISNWYRAFYNGTSDILELTLKQIEDYEHVAARQGIVWAR